MDKQQNSESSSHDVGDTANALVDIAQRSQRLLVEFLERQEGEKTDPDPLNLGSTFLELTSRMMTDPLKMMQAQVNLWSGYMELWQNQARRWMGEEVATSIEPDKGDRRFKDAQWTENQVFDFIKQSYLLTARWMQKTVDEVEGLDPETSRKVDFYTRQFADAMAPSNFVLTNPEVLRTTIESNGENLVKGLQNLLGDLERGKGKLAISMTDFDAFKVGENVASSPGKVVYRNGLIELIQYTPSTEKVHRTPLLIVPPWINKFYILDLRPKNSFIKWAVDQGITVFVVSWVNPDAQLAQKSFADYMLEGPLAALDAIEQATGESQINLIGYCIGGTLSAATLAYMHHKGTAERIKSVTFFTSLVDFDNAGELTVFIDDSQLKSLEDKMNSRGYLDGSEMATTFNMLRANDLIWSFVVNNYLLGKDPFPFDLLYWNSDSTRMPAAMHSFYLRKMYLENKLIEPGGIELDGVPIDLRTIKTPTYILSTREDHIAPWKCTYTATQIYQGPTRFVLSGSGHIAGVVNPPEAKKYGYALNSKNPPTADGWLEGATEHEGSWWPDWYKWLKGYAGRKDVPARQPGSGKLPALCDAPGEYVRAKLT